MKLTDEQKRVAIAEARGILVPLTEFVADAVKRWNAKYGAQNISPRIPDYLNDLNAMHEAFSGLTKEQKDLFACVCEKILSIETDTEEFGPYTGEDGIWEWPSNNFQKGHWIEFPAYDAARLINLTARQRADAFLIVLGKQTLEDLR